MDNTSNHDNATPNPQEPQDVARAWNEYTKIRNVAVQFGAYPLPLPFELVEPAKRYFDNNAPNIAQRMVENGATNETVNAVIEDYGRATVGVMPSATIQQIDAALGVFSPVQAFMVDRYVLYFAVFNSYASILRFYRDYEKNVKQQPAPSQRQAWFETIREEIRPTDAVAFFWMQNHGQIVVSDFAGVEQPAIRRFLNMMEQKANVGRYLRYYAVAKFALMATPEQLAAITPPPQFGEPTEAIRYADEIMAEIQRDFDQKAAQVAGILVKATTGDTAPTEIAKEVKAAAIAINKTPENIALILSRDIYTADGKDAKNILPISRYIEAYLAKRGTDAVYITTNMGQTRVGVTPRTVEKAIEGVNLLQQLRRVRPSNGVFRLETNLSEFSELCGYTDANEEIKLQLLASLMVLNDLYLVVWEGKGRSAVKVLTVPKIGLSGESRGRIIIDVTTEAMRGKPQYVSMTDFDKLRKLAKGQAKNHFRYQILAKGQKDERQLVSEVFGYEYKLDELKDKPDELAKARRYISTHRKDDTKKLRKWFDEYAETGFLSFTREQNANGDWIYKWQRLKPPTPDEVEAVERGKLDTILLKPIDGETGDETAETETFD